VLVDDGRERVAHELIARHAVCNVRDVQVGVEQQEGEDERVHHVGAAVQRRRVARPEALAERMQDAVHLLRLGAQKELVAQLAEGAVDAQAGKVKVGHVVRARQLPHSPPATSCQLCYMLRR
jgi:hypothetical protein